MTWTASPPDSPEMLATVPASDDAAHELAKSLELLEALADTKDQTEAVQTLVTTLGRLLDGAIVRCGVGGARLSRLCDCKLGWLGPASDWFQEMSESWNQEAALPGDNQRASSSRSSTLRFNLDDTASDRRAILLLGGEGVSERDRRWLRRCLPTLRLLLWQRPASPLAQLSHWLSSRGMNARIYLGLIVLFFSLLLIWPVSYRVRCSAVIRPTESRVVAAPFAATLAETHVLPGDTIRVGEPIVTLDGRPLRLELESIDAQIGQIAKERDIAMAGRRVAERQQAELRMRELSRQRDLIVDRLSRLVVASPIDGVVVTGDLRRSIGAPLEVGQAVVEVAPLDRMTIEIEIPEYEIGYVEKRSLARIRLSASHRGTIEKQIDQVYPSAEVRDNENVFIARIDVDNSDGDLRPGMRGNAIAYGPLRPWLWSLVRGSYEKLSWWVGF